MAHHVTTVRVFHAASPISLLWRVLQVTFRMLRLMAVRHMYSQALLLEGFVLCSLSSQLHQTKQATIIDSQLTANH